MWSNVLTSRVVDVNKNSDTLSEISESGTVTSGWNSNWDSREELKDFVIKLGYKDISDLYQDRFRVDRKKLEQMLTGDNDALVPADVFFAKIMEDTDTYITWPNKLKIGAKSKKDPHVRIAGRPEDVQTAKERILTILDTRSNRITMKMDVSYTDHSHIIGKGGRSIKRVMEETHCHVHFPDSNRSNPLEKSNQVSISGDLDGVESARSRVRELIPLIFGFELPIMTQNIDSSCAYVVKIQDQYNVQVMYKTRPKLHASLVLVKGVEWEVRQVKRATILLMEYMCENLANQIPVQMSMEISPHHHQIVLGKNYANLKAIMQATKCQIMFPDAQDPNIASLKKSHVSITGNIHNVYKARQILMGSLPLIIIFDLPEDSTSLKIRPDQIAEIQTECDLVINIRQKAKQNTKACIIKGIERQTDNIYKARNFILGIDEPAISADVPVSYHLPNPALEASPSAELMVPPTNPKPISPLLNSMARPLSPIWQYQPTFGTDPNSFVGSAQALQLMRSRDANNSSGYNSMSQSQVSTSSSLFEQAHDTSTSSISSNGSSMSTSPNNSSWPKYYRNFAEAAPVEKNEVPSIVADLSDEKLEARSSFGTLHDYENKRLTALRAMEQKPAPGQYRIPISTWSGYGFSNTSPCPPASSPSSAAQPTFLPKQEEDIWTPPSKQTDVFNFPSTSVSPNLNSSDPIDQFPNHIMNLVMSSNWTDMPSMLTALGLEQYINVFKFHEIDLITFATFNEKDLLEIGIKTFGARRKLMLAVSELNKRIRPFLMAPGAERRNSSS